MDINFDCTMCGRCCHDLKIPLTVDEAINWLSDGNEVQILTEAVPWPDEADEADVQMNDKRARSFLAMSGSLPTRIVVILAASFSGPCPNLGPEMQCRIYERRPLVCRIYPAEASSVVEFIPANKKCPPEAWGTGRRPFFRQGKVVDPSLQHEIGQMNAAAISSVSTKQKLCATLGIDTASLVNEGFVVYAPAREVMLNALKESDRESGSPDIAAQWSYASNRQTTIDVLSSAKARCLRVSKGDIMPFEYLGFHEPN